MDVVEFPPRVPRSDLVSVGYAVREFAKSLQASRQLSDVERREWQRAYFMICEAQALMVRMAKLERTG